MSTPPSCLLLGANGYIGKALAAALAPGHRLAGFDLAPAPAPSLPKTLRYTQGDFTRCEDFAPLLQGIDVVYHLVSTTLPGPGTAEIPREIEENILPTLRLAEAAAATGTRLVFISSGGTVYGGSGAAPARPGSPTEPICAHGMQKKVIEEYLAFYGRVRGLNWCAARLANPYGPGQDPKKPQGLIPILIHRLRQGQPITLYGNTRRDWLTLEDAAEALALLAGYSGPERIFNIASGETHSLEEVVALILEALGSPKADIRREPPRPFDVADTRLDISLTQRELHWAPRTPLKEGIRRLAQLE